MIPSALGAQVLERRKLLELLAEKRLHQGFGRMRGAGRRDRVRC